jgi:branched-chain amino acid transport system ATP-binding protein
MGMMTKLLDIRDVTVRFGGLLALNRVSFSIEEESIFGLIGPNGAGKSTLINAITGIYKPVSGSIYFDGRRIDALKPHVISRLGIARTFQTLGLFPKMTVLENMLVGFHEQLKGNVFSGALSFPSVWDSERDARRKALESYKKIKKKE